MKDDIEDGIFFSFVDVANNEGENLLRKLARHIIVLLVVRDVSERVDSTSAARVMKNARFIAIILLLVDVISLRATLPVSERLLLLLNIPGRSVTRSTNSN